MSSNSAAAGAASSRTATKRLLKELDTWREEQKEEKGIERLGPSRDEDLYLWEAVINGNGIGSGYDGKRCPSIHPYPIFTPRPQPKSGSLFDLFFFLTRSLSSRPIAGRWLLTISIPSTYPLHAPKIQFVTPILHPNIAPDTGEICLDLLKDAWTPAYSVLESVRAVRMLLSCPETDSPLNVDLAALVRNGDAVGARRLVEFWCSDESSRYNGQ
jgi:peroxin-4